MFLHADVIVCIPSSVRNFLQYLFKHHVIFIQIFLWKYRIVELPGSFSSVDSIIVD